MAERIVACAGWLLAGGEGRRVGGQDKGLLPWRGRPMGDHVLAAMAPQVGGLGIVANRHADRYRALLTHHASGTAHPVAEPPAPTSLGVHADDPGLPPFSGPLAGMLTAMAATPQEWIWFLPCDMPRLPGDVLATLWRAAHRDGADVAVPCTPDGLDGSRHHWVCALMHKRVRPTLQTAFISGERKVGHLIARCKWTSVSFADAAGFANFNTLETKHGGD